MGIVYTYQLQTIACRVVSTSNLSATYTNGNAGFGAQLVGTSNGALSVDSVTLNANDLVLVQNQSSSFENGPYQVIDTGNISSPFVLQRASFFQTPTVASVGSSIPISAGTVDAGSIWVLVEPQPAVIGTDAITFIKS